MGYLTNATFEGQITQQARRHDDRARALLPRALEPKAGPDREELIIMRKSTDEFAFLVDVLCIRSAS